ncbi:MAG: hypothetical protein R3353_00965 [Salegentibacter mishustinae]|nr:hypothetical protein [Salegentibacter mishustinae]
MNDIYSESIFSTLENKKIHYGENLRDLIDLITKVQSKIDLEDAKVFGKHIHAFTWAFFTGTYYNKKEVPEKWSYTDTFSLGTIKRDEGQLAADAMLLIALGEYETENLEQNLVSQSGIRSLLNIISQYAEGGAKYIMEIRSGDDINDQNFLNNINHFFDEIKKRAKNTIPQ